MNETLIKNIIKYKLNAAERMLEKLPSEVSNNLKNLGKIILESVNESAQKTKSAEKLNNINIE